MPVPVPLERPCHRDFSAQKCLQSSITLFARERVRMVELAEFVELEQLETAAVWMVRVMDYVPLCHAREL